MNRHLGTSRPKTALVTGGASGIGLETGRELTRRGWRVALVDLDSSRVEAAAEECGAGTLALRADVADPDAIVAAIDQAASRLGGLNAVMASAGIASWGMVRSVDREHWERTVEVNLFGAWRTARAAIPHVVASRGYLLLVSSLAAAMGPPGMSSYAVSKAGVETLGRCLRLELAHLGVEVGVAYYSWIRTPMVSEADEHPAFARLRAAVRGPLARTYPVDAAATATADAIERRAARVCHPHWVRAVLALRGMAGPTSERGLSAVTPELDRLSDDEIARHGADAALPPRRRIASGAPG